MNTTSGYSKKLKIPVIGLLLLLIILSFNNTTKSVFQNDNFDNKSAITEKPNIIFILLDDVGYEIPTYTGGESYNTPNLDMLAANGRQFTQCYSSPLCSPSRFMLLTGKYNFRNYTDWGKMNRNEKTIATLLKTNGYETCCAGKWQFDGGDSSIRSLGFDKYLVTNPFEGTIQSTAGTAKGKYKFPAIYSNGKFWPDSMVFDKYGDDIIKDYVINYLDSTASNGNSKPFFIYWAPNLCHDPKSPTPDNPEFASWNPLNEEDDSTFFPSMVNYMDKGIGQVINRLYQLNLIKNTIIFITADNGTDNKTSRWNGIEVNGQKGYPNISGTHVPLIAFGPGSIQEGSIDSGLIDFTDFLPTIASVTNSVIPSSFGVIDGLSFGPRIFGQSCQEREWIFCHFLPYSDNGDTLRRWMQNKYCLRFDDFPAIKEGFYDIVKDPYVTSNIPLIDQNYQQRQWNDEFLVQMKLLH